MTKIHESLPDTSITNNTNSHTGSQTSQTTSKARGQMGKAIKQPVVARVN